MPSPIKVLRVIPRYAPAWAYGGGVRFSADLDAALSRKGVRITVYTSDQIDGRTRASQSRDMLGDVDVRRFPNWSNRFASGAQWLAFHPLGLRRALMTEAGGFDVVHVAEARGLHVKWAFAAARAAGIPIVWSPLGGLAEGVGIRKPYRRLYDVAHGTRRLIREARVLIAQSAHEAALLKHLGAQASQLRMIGLGVDARRFHELPQRGEFRRAAGIDPNRPLVLFMGRFHPSKGLDVLLKAVAIAKRTYPDLAIVLVGWDHGALRMVHRLSRRFTLEDALWVVPPVFGGAAVQAYVDADVFAVAATIYEETSLAAMEALACGTPCVLTRQVEVPGIETAGGGVVTSSNPESFAAGLLAVLSNPARRMRAQAARRMILGARTAEQVADAYAATFREILQSGEGASGANAARAAR